MRFETAFRIGARFAVCLALLSTAWAYAAHDGEISVAHVIPLSGVSGATGAGYSLGARILFDHVNARGGVRGRKIRYVVYDDALETERSVQLVRRALEKDKPVAFLGLFGTPNFLAVHADGAISTAGVAMVGGATGASAVAALPGVYAVKPHYADEVDAFFRQLSTVALSRVAFVYQDDNFGRDVLASAESIKGRYGIQIVHAAGYERNTNKVEPAVQSLLDARPQAIFLAAATSAGIEFIRQYRQRGGAAQLYGLSIVDSKQVVEKLGSLANGYAFSSVLPLPSRTWIAVRREFDQLAAGRPGTTTRSIEGFIAAKAVVHAMEQANELTPAGVKRALNAMKGVNMGDFFLDFSVPGQAGSRRVEYVMIGKSGSIIR